MAPLKRPGGIEPRCARGWGSAISAFRYFIPARSEKSYMLRRVSPSSTKYMGRRVDVSATASYLPGVVIWRSSGPFVEKSPNRIAMLQLEASQSRRVTTYRVTFELFIPQMASILAFFSRLF